MAKLTKTDWRAIEAYAFHNMNASAAARAFFMSLNSFEFHLAKVKRITGLDPKRFYDLVELLRVRADNGL